MMFLLDTDHAILIQRGEGPELQRLLERMLAYPAADFFYPVVAFHEQVLGANAYISRAKKRPELVRGYRLLQQVLTDFSLAQVLPFDDASAAIFESLRAQRVRTATMDLRIASIALAQNMTVLTRNTCDFEQIPGLRVEDWTIT